MCSNYVLDSNSYDVTISVPADLFRQVNQISISFQSDIESDIVHLMECYVNSFQQIHSDPVGKILLPVEV